MCVADDGEQVMDLFGRVQHFKFKGKELKQCVDGEFDDGEPAAAA